LYKITNSYNLKIPIEKTKVTAFMEKQIIRPKLILENLIFGGDFIWWLWQGGWQEAAVMGRGDRRRRRIQCSTYRDVVSMLNALVFSFF
jgi:hypothetical protein